MLLHSLHSTLFLIMQLSCLLTTYLANSSTEEAPLDPVLSAEEQAAVNHYQANHSRSPEGRFIVLLPKPNILMFLILVSPGHKQSENFSLWKDHFVPRVNSTTLLKS